MTKKTRRIDEWVSAGFGIEFEHGTNLGQVKLSAPRSSTAHSLKPEEAFELGQYLQEAARSAGYSPKRETAEATPTPTPTPFASGGRRGQ